MLPCQKTVWLHTNNYDVKQPHKSAAVEALMCSLNMQKVWIFDDLKLNTKNND